jgi:hypothetical protein
VLGSTSNTGSGFGSAIRRRHDPPGALVILAKMVHGPSCLIGVLLESEMHLLRQRMDALLSVWLPLRLLCQQNL